MKPIYNSTNKSEFVTKLKLLIENDEIREKMKLKDGKTYTRNTATRDLRRM